MSIKIDDFKEIENTFGDIRKYMKYNCDQSIVDGHIMEFGVYKGSTINHIADVLPETTVHGFDSFEGLPEEWMISEDAIVETGMFKTKELPKVRKNVKLHVGLFYDTLPTWQAENPGNIAMIHLDCDIYSSTQTVLEMLNSTIKPGTVVIFDDLYAWQDEDDYPFWRRGQWKALKEWEKESGREFEVLSRTRRRHSGAIKVIK